MKRLKFIGALLGLAAATAAASPTVASAIYFNPYNTGIKFLVTGGTSVGLKTIWGVTYTCSGSKGNGEIIGERQANVSLTLTGCKASGLSCQSAGANAGEVRLGSSEALLVYTDMEREHEKAALLLHRNGGEWAMWTCAGKPQGIVGSIVAPITPINFKTGFHNLKLEENGSGEQRPDQYYDFEERLTTAFPELELVSSGFAPGAVSTTLSLSSTPGFEVVT